jgi:AcrR family transcriptional regulator
VASRTDHNAGRPAATLAGVTQAPSARGRPRSGDVDQRILAATFQQLVEVGYGALSIEAVAAQAGVAKTTIYRRYATKSDLVVAALRVEVPFVPPSEGLPAREALDAFVHQAIGMLVDSGAIRILGSFLVEEAREPGLLDVFRSRVLEPRRRIVEGMLRRGIERGEIRADIDPLIVTEMIAGAILGHHAILGLAGTDAWVTALVDHVWEAIKAP